MLSTSYLMIWMILLSTIDGQPDVSYNRPKLCPDATWNPDAATFADKTIVGDEPRGIFINNNDVICVANLKKDQVVVWSKGQSSSSSKINVKSNPRSLFVTISGDIYFEADKKVFQWVLANQSLVARMPVQEHCYGLFIDISDTLYCSVKEHHYIIKKSLNDTAGSWKTAAGDYDSRGSNQDQLDSPYGIFVHINFSLYVADCKNDRIQLFQFNQTQGITVARKEQFGNKDLNCPTAVVLDADANLFIVDQNNHRIVRSGPKGFHCLVGCRGEEGSAADRLRYPRSLAFDSFGNIFVTDKDNRRIQKFLLASNSCNATRSSEPATVPTISTETQFVSISTAPKRTDETISTEPISSTSIMNTMTSSVDTSSILVSSTHISSSTNKIEIITTILTTEITSTIEMTTSTTTTIKQIIDKQSAQSFTPKQCNDTNTIGTNCNVSNNPCHMPNTCKNGGRCRKTHHSYDCVCPSGFNGTHCDFDHRPCKSYTCSNNGICKETSSTTFNCTCHKGWENLHCESMMNFCKSNPCLNKGVCRPSVLNYTCECLDGYFGQHCEDMEKKIIMHQIVTKSFSYIAIIAIVCLATFVLIMDILKYCFGIDPVEEERERIRQRKRIQERKRAKI